MAISDVLRNVKELKDQKGNVKDCTGPFRGLRCDHLEVSDGYEASFLEALSGAGEGGGST